MFIAKKFISENVSGGYLDYLEYCPKCEEKLPLLIYIHGAGVVCGRCSGVRRRNVLECGKT